MVSDFLTFGLHDLDGWDVFAFRLADLPSCVEAFGFIFGFQRRMFRDQHPASIEAADLVRRLRDGLEAAVWIPGTLGPCGRPASVDHSNSSAGLSWGPIDSGSE